jgi:hypothetical protein
MPPPGGIRTQNPSKRTAVDLRLRPHSHWDRKSRGLRNVNSLFIISGHRHNSIQPKTRIVSHKPAATLRSRSFMSICSIVEDTRDYSNPHSQSFTQTYLRSIACVLYFVLETLCVVEFDNGDESKVMMGEDRQIWSFTNMCVMKSNLCNIYLQLIRPYTATYFRVVSSPSSGGGNVYMWQLVRIVRLSRLPAPSMEWNQPTTHTNCHVYLLLPPDDGLLTRPKHVDILCLINWR